MAKLPLCNSCSCLRCDHTAATCMSVHNGPSWFGLITRWSRGGKACGGSKERAIKGCFAVRVTECMTGKMWFENGSWWLICPVTLRPFTIETGEVDKAVGAAGLGEYEAGNICMTSKMSNQGRSGLQQYKGDMPGHARYVADVLAASANVHIMRGCDAMPLWESWGRGSVMGIAQIMAGPYGEA